MNAKAQTGFACPCATGTNDFNVDAAGRTLGAIIAAMELPATLPTGSCVAIRGLIQINQAYTINGAEMRMQPGSEILMKNNVHLNIQNSNIHGCDTMWIGITLEQGRLTFDNNDISDAQWAIRWRCLSTTSQPCIPATRRMNVTNSRFDRNHIGIHVVPIGGVPLPSLAFTNTTIHSDTFTCSGNLLPRFDAGLPNYQQTNAYAAMDINTTTSTFNIGSTNAAESILISSDENNGIRNGIIARNCGSRFYIENVDILDPVGGVGTGTVNLTSPEGIGILLESIANAYVFDGTTLSSDRGIYAQGGFQLQVRRNVFTSDFIAFHIMGAAPNATIENNKFVEYEHNGVRAESANAIGTLIVNSDTFLHSHPVFQNPTTTPNSTAVAIIGTSGTFGGIGNKVISNSIFDIDAQDVAINLLADSRYSIINNNVAYGSGGSGFSNNQGIIHINGNDNFLYGNHIVEDVNSKPQNSYSVIAGENVVLCCNTTERSVRGVYFEGNCDNSKLRHTGFGEHFRALFCNAATIMGVQTIAANLWPPVTPPGSQDVEHLGVDAEVIGSLFTVPSPIAAPYWPDNIITPNATVNWFNIDTLGTNPVCGSDEECAPSFLMLLGGGEEELTENNRVAAESGYEHERYGDMLNWETRRSLYAKLMRNPALLGEDESIAGFYETASGSAIGDFHAVWEAAKSIGRLTEEESAAMEAFSLEVDAQHARLSVVDALFATTEDPEEIAELEADREAILETLGEVNAGILEILETEKARSKELAASLYTQNATLDAAILPAQNEKALNQVIFEMAAEGVQELNDEQFEVVAAIANQCPLDGGHSVYRARAIYERKQPGGFMDSLLCLQIQELARPGAQGFMAQNNRTSVFPNPAANELSVRIPTDLVGNTISLRLHTLTGQPALYYFDSESAETLQKLDVSALTAGVYTLTVRVDGQVIGTHKVILIK